jgi:NADPH:quinone reductase-like Zn-dependent oxidoreductase
VGLDQPRQFPGSSLAVQTRSDNGKGRTIMRAMRAEQFKGYEALKLVQLPKPAATDGRVLVRITAAGVTPLDHTILIGDFHIPEKPLILGNEGAGVVEGEAERISRWLTRDVLGHLWRF